jgi:hypothetical protein
MEHDADVSRKSFAMRRQANVAAKKNCGHRPVGCDYRYARI